MIAATQQTSPIELKGESILSFQLERWTDVWRNRHHIMSRLARDNKVLFCDPPVYIRDVIPREQNRPSKLSGLSHISLGLNSYVPPRWLPYGYRYPNVQRITKQLRVRGIRKAMSSLHMQEPILYLWYPSFNDMVGQFAEKLLVYHIYDEYASFTDQTDAERALIAEQEKRLLQQADIVFVTSEVICARKRSLNSNIHIVTNGVDYPLFSQAQLESTLVPEDLRSIPAPVIGCVATQTPYMDLSLLHKIFTLRPDWSFVFIGINPPDESQADRELLEFQRLANVFFIGRRKISEIPGYLKGCDVCVIPWIINDVTLSGSPLKLYEYLAAGKPVISKPLSYISHLQSVITFAEDSTDWIAAIEDALHQNESEHIHHRQEIALQNDWDQRTAFICSKIAEALSRRG